MKLRRNRELLRIALAAVLAMLVAPALAQASTTVGQVDPPGLFLTCNTGGEPGEMVQVINTTGNSYAVPTGGGVITSWSTQASGSGSIRLRVYSATSSAQSITPVAESEPVALAADAQPAHPTRILVSGGEHIGFGVSNSGGTGCVAANNDPTDVVVRAIGSGPLNVSNPIGLPNSDAQSTALLSIAATVEPDADGDGFGDDTQDLCPSQATTQSACSNAFTIGKPTLNKKKGTATLNVDLPGPGSVSLSGERVASQELTAATVGTVALTVKPTGKAKRKLAKKGKLKVGFDIAYTPTGGEQGTQQKSIKPRKKAKRKR
ncbi:MAG: hypothetical protein U0R24_01315 [Solirubrobacterales bacterium]